MAGTNTEKPASKAEQKKTAPVAKAKAQAEKAPVKTEKKAEKKEATKLAEKKNEKKQAKAPKKESVKAYGRSLPVSTKVASAICKFIRGKTIDKAILDLEAVIKLKKAVPMKGEIPHRKGPIMSGRFPERAAGNVLNLVKSLKSNATQHDIEVPVITEAIPNKAQRPYAKGGRARRKATHITLVATEKKSIKQKKNKK
jgi:ribosomal protein L22